VSDGVEPLQVDPNSIPTIINPRAWVSHTSSLHRTEAATCRQAIFTFRAKSYRLNMMLRSVKNSGATDAKAYARRLKIYSFSEAGNTHHNKVLDSFSRAWDSLPHYDTRFYRYIADLVNIESARQLLRLLGPPE
jgi:hypothetical protein